MLKVTCAALAFFATTIAGSPLSEQTSRSAENDRAALESIERLWLASEHDGATLERILADDFVHPVSAGVFLSKRQHIEWAVAHPATNQAAQRFDRLQIRIYANVGLVTGMVMTTGTDGRERRTVFTDVFVKRDGRWQAVNAQETIVDAPDLRPIQAERLFHFRGQ